LITMLVIISSIETPPVIAGSTAAEVLPAQ